MLRYLVYPSFLAALVVAGCAGEAPVLGDDDPSPDAGDNTDAPEVAPIRVSGKSLDYFTLQPLATVQLSTEGMAPELTGASDAQGNYALDNVPVGSVFYVSAVRDVYRPTRNTLVRVADASVMTDLLLVSVLDARRQYASLNLTPTAGQAVLFADLRRNNGMPLEGVPLADIQLLDAANAPVGKGPFFFGQAGDVVSNATLAVSTAFNGRARVAFLDVPPGNYTLKVANPPDGGGGGGGFATLRV